MKACIEEECQTDKAKAYITAMIRMDEHPVCSERIPVDNIADARGRLAAKYKEREQQTATGSSRAFPEWQEQTILLSSRINEPALIG